MFVIGERVKLPTNERGDCLLTYHTDGNSSIPRALMRHGGTYFKDRNNIGVVEAIHEEYYLVAFTDTDGGNVRLGFLANELKATKVNNWRSKLNARR